MTISRTDGETVSKRRRGAGRPFPRGNAGRPPGHKTTKSESLLADNAEELTRRAIELGLGGYQGALRFCLGQVHRPMKDRSVKITLPPIHSPSDLPNATASILSDVANGRLTPREGLDIMKIVEGHIKSLQVREIARRLERIESNLNRRPLIDVGNRPRQFVEPSDDPE
jgi:hypothetical protein